MRSLSSTALLLVLLPRVLASPAAASQPPAEIVRGVTVSTHTNGREWGTAAMSPTLQEIKELGANWVAIHPYARISADGSVRFAAIDPHDPPPYLRRPILEAHRRGLKILIKPHLAYWGSPFSWRGEIAFDRDEEWARFWAGYEAWIVSLARACHDADGFVVGTELDRTLAFETRWRRLISLVRQETEAPLTYAANWPDYERVPFWDALDAIGIQAYFPLTDRHGADEAELRRAWQRLMEGLRTYAERQNRNIVFTELGYNRSFQAAVRPWEYATDGLDAEPLQETCMRVALAAIEAEPWVVGAFLWKWFPHPRPVGRNFQLATPVMRRVIRDAWRTSPRTPY